MTAFRAAVAAVLTVQAGVVDAACLTEAQFNAVARFLAPDLIKAGADKCAPLLTPTAYIRRSGAALADRYRPGAATAWPEVKAAMASQPDLKLFTMIDEQTARGLIMPMLGESLAKEKLSARDCAAADEIAANLDPLPPANFIALITAIVRLDKGRPSRTPDGKPRAPVICPVVK
ncbi:MAG TPA: hypothetical protein VL405_00445 [Sphingomonas sp.]|nr:hypothetical protein [Sphingomonas sp.]